MGKRVLLTHHIYRRNLLPKDIIFEHLDNNNSNQYFKKSRMYGLN